MYTIYGDQLSGNCYKIKLLLQLRNIKHQWQHIDILANETNSDSFKLKNFNAEIPVLKISNSEYLSQSNAILNYLAEGSEYLPDSGLERAKVLQWQFFEQYSHEPYIAVARYINKYLGLPEDRIQEYHSKQAGGHKALTVIEQQLKNTRFIVGDWITIADISLYAYTHVAHEGGFNLNNYPNIQNWLLDIEALPNYVAMSRECVQQ